MDRLPYWTRARRRIWQEACASLKGAKRPVTIGLVGVVLGLLLNHFWLHKDTAQEIAILGAVSIGGSYVIWFLGAFVVNTFRVPWLLDAESGEQINALESRAIASETALNDKNKKQELFARLAGLMTEAEPLAQELRRGFRHSGHTLRWLDKRARWVSWVSQVLTEMGLAAEAADFRHASEPISKPVPPGKTVNDDYFLSVYKEELDNGRKKLQEISRQLGK